MCFVKFSNQFHFHYSHHKTFMGMYRVTFSEYSKDAFAWSNNLNKDMQKRNELMMFFCCFPTFCEVFSLVDRAKTFLIDSMSRTYSGDELDKIRLILLLHRDGCL